MRAHALQARRVHARHPRAERDAVRDVSLALVTGEVLALVGPNGSGKSTALALLGRTLRPRAGAVLAGEGNAWDLTPREFALRVARLPQYPVCPEGLSVEELVRSGRHAHRRWLAPLAVDDASAVREAMRAVDVLDLRRRAVDTLSGGERRRAWLAMVLAQAAPVLLLDEPTAALDLRHQREVLSLLERLNRERGITIGVVLHDLEHAAGLAHRVAVLHRGRLYDVGPPARCITPEMLRDVFGVEATVTPEGAGLAIRVRGPSNPIRSL